MLPQTKEKGVTAEGPKRKSKQNTTTATNPQKKAKPNPKKPTSKDAPPQKVKNPRAATQHEPTLVDPESLHPWLEMLKGDDRARMLKLYPKRLKAARTFDSELLKDFGCYERVKELIKDKAWDRFFSISKPSYQTLTLEFLSTFRFDIVDPPYDQTKAIRFHLGGQEITCSLLEWAQIFKLCTPAECKRPQFIEAFTEAWVDWPETFKRKHFEHYWKKIAVGEFNAPSAHCIKDTALRMVHRAISHTILQRKGSTSTVTDRDLFILYCMTGGQACNVAHILATYFSKFTRGTTPASLTGGCYVTVLAEHFKILQPAVRRQLTPGPAMGLLDVGFLVRCGMVLVDEVSPLGIMLAPEGGRLPTDRPQQVPTRRLPADLVARYRTTVQVTQDVPTEPSSVGGSATTERPVAPGHRATIHDVYGLLSALLTRVERLKSFHDQSLANQQRIIQLLTATPTPTPGASTSLCVTTDPLQTTTLSGTLSDPAICTTILTTTIPPTPIITSIQTSSDITITTSPTITPSTTCTTEMIPPSITLLRDVESDSAAEVETRKLGDEVTHKEDDKGTVGAEVTQSTNETSSSSGVLDDTI